MLTIVSLFSRFSCLISSSFSRLVNFEFIFESFVNFMSLFLSSADELTIKTIFFVLNDSLQTRKHSKLMNMVLTITHKNNVRISMLTNAYQDSFMKKCFLQVEMVKCSKIYFLMHYTLWKTVLRI